MRIARAHHSKVCASAAAHLLVCLLRVKSSRRAAADHPTVLPLLTRSCPCYLALAGFEWVQWKHERSSANSTVSRIDRQRQPCCLWRFEMRAPATISSESRRALARLSWVIGGSSITSYPTTWAGPPMSSS